ncbi:hypothetical protein K490DRAFT_55054 [Saccharata proteae CBS 121410]|uniref:PH domain-containing protein n=1 Tax=Saccharata proteae CBS 121410 TaxID=1314787 RepID=A0A6A5YD87_9PEZI|nr:hypothetical protein K490DRAFT_55054 [Saccharata proteae CBS 121410]
MAHHDDENAASIGLRRGLKTLPPIQTSLDNTDSQASRWKRVRPVVPIVDQPQQPQSQQSFEPAPTLRPKPESRKLENRKSTMSLFNLFSRPKVERARGHHEAALPSTRDESPRSPAQLPPASRPSTQMDTVTVAPQPKPQPPPVKRSGSRPSTAKSGRGSLSRRARHASAWDPPPLFQAYPQAVKHAKLQAPHASTETIMKTQAHRRQYSMLQEKLESKLDLSKDAEDDAEGGDKKPEKSQRRPSLTSTLTPPDLPQKVYILTTSGHMLQYSGAGESNRLPEKVLQLGKDSAAFACDLIPGKHWVLQISQATNDDGTMTAQQPKSILSKLRMHGPTARKAATNLLMIFENPEEMGKWLVALRQEIDILAGRKSRSDADYEASNESNDMPELEKKTSHRYLNIGYRRYNDELPSFLQGSSIPTERTCAQLD